RKRFLSIPNIRVFTFAPEIEGAGILVEEALPADKIPSIGHSNALYRDVLPFLEKGVRHMTHFPNAMRGLYHREIGLLGAGLLENDLDLEMIADGIHTAPEFIRLVHRIKGPHFSITSDMIPPACSSDGALDKSGLRLVNGALVDRQGTIAGGSMPVPEQAGLLLKLGFSVEDIVRIACLNGRRFFGLPSPEIGEGEEATFIVCNSDLSLRAFYLKGKIIR
ncbi:MAG: amidohydrolase family protein, partial [Candidatus Aminicenantes bacterium]|nr:amidohydrolase family protein [Candidatus Aminicenantes bacterium]